MARKSAVLGQLISNRLVGDPKEPIGFDGWGARFVFDWLGLTDFVDF